MGPDLSRRLWTARCSVSVFRCAVPGGESRHSKFGAGFCAVATRVRVFPTYFGRLEALLETLPTRSGCSRIRSRTLRTRSRTSRIRSRTLRPTLAGSDLGARHVVPAAGLSGLARGVAESGREPSEVGRDRPFGPGAKTILLSLSFYRNPSRYNSPRASRGVGHAAISPRSVVLQSEERNLHHAEHRELICRHYP